MKISDFVKQHIQQILVYCDTMDHNELSYLLDLGYSNRIFGLNFPFCRETAHITPDQSKRYWGNEYMVRNKCIRVTSQWYERQRSSFIHYLSSKQISSTQILSDTTVSYNQDIISSRIQLPLPVLPSSRRSNSRYRGNHIGNAQNLFIRNLLSNLGYESFSEQDWEATKTYFANRCAYCGDATTLVMDHAIPINKDQLGEHRLGNLVPSCSSCNATKAGKDFRTILVENSVAIQMIEAYMESRNYTPLTDNEQMRRILKLAHSEIAALADRYITIINELFPRDQQVGPDAYGIEAGDS